MDDVVIPQNWTHVKVQVQSVRERGITNDKARTFTLEFKAQLVLEELTGVKASPRFVESIDSNQVLIIVSAIGSGSAQLTQIDADSR